MSEYQYYEFQSVDRPLNEQELEYLRSLSSRVQLSSSRAVYVYNWGDFRAREDEVLEKYFDALLYITNWGTRRLMFRLPRSAVDVTALRQYEISDVVAVKVTQDHVIVDIYINKEEAEWILEEEWQLTPLIPLREDLMHGDYRALYLAWLRACTLDLWACMEEGKGRFEVQFTDECLKNSDTDPNDIEPPVPPGLKQATAALTELIDFVELHPALVEAAAETSEQHAKTLEPIGEWIAALSEADSKKYLNDVLTGDAGAKSRITGQLRERFQPKAAASPRRPRRNIKDIFTKAQAVAERTRAEQRRKQQIQRIEKLDKLAAREDQVWQAIDELIPQKRGTAYDRAVGLLRELHELAEHRGTLAAFNARLEQIKAAQSPQSALLKRLKQAKL